MRCLAVALAASIAFWLWDGSRFSWHPTLMAVGFLGLMSEGVLASLRLRGIDAGPERVRGIQRHALIQAAALACAAGGLYAIYTNKVCRISAVQAVICRQAMICRRVRARWSGSSELAACVR